MAIEGNMMQNYLKCLALSMLLMIASMLVVGSTFAADSDGDGTPDSMDTDADNDGVPNSQDATPLGNRPGAPGMMPQGAPMAMPQAVPVPTQQQAYQAPPLLQETGELRLCLVPLGN